MLNMTGLIALPQRRRWFWASLITAMLVAGLMDQVNAAPAPVQSITVDLHRTVTPRIMGLGVQWEQYAYPPGTRAWQTILQRVSFMRPSFLRVMSWTNSGDWKAQPEVPLILGWAQRHHSQVILGTWWAPPLYHRYMHKPMPPAALHRWAHDTARGIARLRRKDGFTCIHFYNFINEPQHIPIQRWLMVAKALQAAFVRQGLARSVKIIGPDTYGDPRNRPAYNFPLLRSVARYASSLAGMYDIHWYPEDDEVENGIIESTLVREKHLVQTLDPSAMHKPFVVSESGLIQGRCNGDQQPRVKTFTYGVLMADYAAQVFRAGWDGISAWNLDDAMCVVNGKPIIHPPGKLTLKIWGFWNSQGPAMGDPADFNIRPWYYTWSLMSRMFPAGTRIIHSTVPTDNTSFRTLAGTRMVHGRRRISIMLVNDSPKPVQVRLRVASDTQPTTLTQYRYFRDDHPVDSLGFPIAAMTVQAAIPSHEITISMPGRGVVFLINRPPFAVP